MCDLGNTESYGPIGIATNDARLYPWLIRRPVRECVTWELLSLWGVCNCSMFCLRNSFALAVICCLIYHWLKVSR